MGTYAKNAWKAMMIASGILFSSSAAPKSCALDRPSDFELSLIKSEFAKVICSGSSIIACEKRWNNLSPLVLKLTKDPRVPTIGTAAYILATVYVETGITDFDPGSRERKRPSPAYCAGMHSPPDPCPYFGRGWVQLTYFDKYQRAAKSIGVDIVRHPELAELPENSYNILVGGMTQGALENYRGTSGGGCTKSAPCSVPIKLEHFVNQEYVDYESARAVINANCVNPPSANTLATAKKDCHDVIYRSLGFIPLPNRLDAGAMAANIARKFEAIKWTHPSRQFLPEFKLWS